MVKTIGAIEPIRVKPGRKRPRWVLGLRPDHLALPVSTDAGVSGRGDAWHTMSLVYLVGGLALVVCSGVLFVLRGAVGVPARVRRWMNPFASPLIALVGCAAYAVVGSLVVLAVSRAFAAVRAELDRRRHRLVRGERRRGPRDRVLWR